MGLHSRTPSGPAVKVDCTQRPKTRLHPTNTPKHRNPTCNAGAIQTGQRVGQPLADAPLMQVGAAGYSANGVEPRVHRIVNSDEGPSQFIVVELRRPRPRGDAVSSRESAPQYAQIVENERMRAWRLILEPGQSVPSISQGGDGLRVVVRGGLLTTTTAGVPDQTLFVQAGDFALQSSGSTRALRNSGTETIELVEIELK